MLEFVVIDTKMIRVGSKLTANSKAERRGICNTNEVLTVIKIRTEDQPYIGVRSDYDHSLWGNLEGSTEDHRGMWLEGNSIFKYFSLESDSIIINKDFKFKNKNLKGMGCKILYQDKRNDQYFVEFVDNIGGGSADGMGKTGHCIVLPGNLWENNKAKQKPLMESCNLNDILEESNQSPTQENKSTDFLIQLADTAMEVFNKATLKKLQAEYENNGESTEFLNQMSKITTQLTSYVDDVLEFATLPVFPETGETGKIYVDLSTSKAYRWSGNTYIYINSNTVNSVAGKTIHDKIKLKMKKVGVVDVLGTGISKIVNDNDEIPRAITNDWTEEDYNATIPEDIVENYSEEEYESLHDHEETEHRFINVRTKTKYKLHQQDDNF